MNKHLLLALIAIPLIAGCESNGSSSTQQANNDDILAEADIGPVSDSSAPNFSVVTNTEPGIILDRVVYDLMREDCDHPSAGPKTIEIDVPPITQIVSVNVYWEALYESGKIKSGIEPILFDDDVLYYQSTVLGDERIDIIKIMCSDIEKHFVSPADDLPDDLVEAKKELRIIIAL